jgi:hypothetical protein
MPNAELTPGQKAALTRERRKAELTKIRSDAAKRVWKKRRSMDAWDKAHASEAASKEALKRYCLKHGWKVAFFEGKTGAPRTGIIDAVAFRIARGQADVLDLRLVQLKGGNAGVTGREIARLKQAAESVVVNWLIAAFDGEDLHIVPDLES